MTQAYQVCHELTEENLSRELTGLQQAMDLTDAQQGAILTFDQEDEVNGIPVMPVWQWCLEYGL